MMERFNKRGAPEDTPTPESAAKKPRIPALTGVIIEALKVDSLQRLSSTLEPLLRRIVSEEVERALTKLGHAKLAARDSPQRIAGPGGRKLQLHFRSRLQIHPFTGGKVEGEQGVAIHVVLLDANTGVVVPSGPESMAKLNVVVLEGDFNEEANEDWSEEQFESYEVKEREGKRPILTGDLQFSLKGGVGTLGDLSFTDNSSWVRSRKFRLGVKVAEGYCDGIRIREAKTEAFVVKDHRGQLYKKHYPPALHDEVWRLDRIAKDGALHKKLVGANILTVEDFLRFLVRDPQKLRSILGSGMSNRKWDNTVEHARTCVLGAKLYVYYSEETGKTGAVFNHIYELRGLVANGQFLPVESISHDQKISVDLLVKRAYDDWDHVVEYDGQSLLSSISNNQEAQLPPLVPDYNSSFDECSLPTIRPGDCCTSKGGRHGQNERSQSTLSVRPALAMPQTSYAITSTSGEWSHIQEDWVHEDFISEEEIRIRSSEMLEHVDMQHLLRSITTGVEEINDTDETCHFSPTFEPQAKCGFRQEGNRSNAKATVSWLKLKAAFRWGIFVRKRAAERRAQLVELD